MTFRGLLVVGAALFSLGASACAAHRPRPVEKPSKTIGDEASWVQVQEDEGGYSVLMPAGAERRYESKDGTVAVTWRGMSRYGSSYLTMSFWGNTVLDGSPEKSLVDTVRGVARGCDGSVDNASGIEVEGDQVMIFSGDCKTGPMGGVVRAHGERIYVLLVVSNGEPKDDVVKFIKSFRITGGSDPSSPNEEKF